MKENTTCILCKIEGTPLILNDLAMYKCPSCDLIWRQNFDITIQYYEQNAINLSHSKIQERLNNCRDRITTILKHVEIHGVCDIGCGEGLFLTALMESGYQNVIGIEPNDKIRQFKIDNKLQIVKGTIEDACLVTHGKESINLFTMFHLIEHLADPKNSLLRLKECMKSGDHLVIETPDIDSRVFKASNFEHPLVYEKHLYYFNRQNLKMLLAACGFEVIASGKRGFDQRNTSIKSSLERLGLMKYTPSSRQEESGIGKTRYYPGPSGESSKALSLIKKLVRRSLSLAVIFLGRTDYQWIIVIKK